MTVSVTHSKVAALPDGPDPSQIQTTDWNAGHVVSGVTDEKAKVSSNDTTAGYLNGKLVAGTGVSLTENNDGSNETLTIAATGSSSDEKAKVSSNDTTAGYLNGKLVAGTNVTLTENNDGGNETLTIAASGGGGGGGGISRSTTTIRNECFRITTTDVYEGAIQSATSGTGAAVNGSSTLETGRPGVIDLLAGTTTTGKANLSSAAIVRLGTAAITFEALVQLPLLSDGTNTFTVLCGFGLSATTIDSDEVVGFRYTHGSNSGNWSGSTRHNPTFNLFNTGVAASDTDWVALKFVIAADLSQVEWFVNGSSTGTSSTGIPPNSVDLRFVPVAIVKSAGTSSRKIQVDAYWYTFDFATPR